MTTCCSPAVRSMRTSGTKNGKTCAPGLKNLPQATEIRRRVLEAFEVAERETHPEERRRQLTFIVIGGGPTGVELAGAIGEMSRYTLARDFRSIDPRQTRVILVEAGPRILTSFDDKLAARAMRDLESLGVQVWTGARVTDVTPEGVVVGNEKIAAATVLWAAGVRAADIGRTLGVPVDQAGRVITAPDLTIEGHPEVFVLGDMSNRAGCERQAPAGRRAGRDAGSDLRGGSHQERSRWPRAVAASGVRIFRSRSDGDHRSQPRDRRIPRLEDERRVRLVVLAAGAHLSIERFSQSNDRCWCIGRGRT